MKLDCIEIDDKWAVIDRDDSCAAIAEGATVEEAWYLAACSLEKIINRVARELSHA